MNGIIKEINYDKGIIAIELRHRHSYTVIHSADAAGMEIGDELEWSLDGHSEFKNLTKGITFVAAFKNHGVLKAQLPSQLLLDEAVHELPLV
jgi:hypothetical protein